MAYLSFAEKKVILLSSFLIILWMFLRWVIIKIKATITENPVRIGLVLPNITFKIIGKLSPANIADRETILVEKKTAKKISKDKEQAKGRIQITIPKMVATPLPPLKP